MLRWGMAAHFVFLGRRWNYDGCVSHIFQNQEIMILPTLSRSAHSTVGRRVTPNISCSHFQFRVLQLKGS